MSLVSDQGAERIDVVFVLGALTRGGTELQAVALMRALVARGVRVRAVVVEALGEAEVEGVETVSLKVGRGLRALPGLVRAAFVLRRQLKGSAPCVVHSALARAYLLTALVRPKGVRHVTWRRNMGVHLEGRHGIGRALERFAARRSDVVVANSAAAAGYWAHLLPRQTKILVVPNSLDSRFFSDSPRTRSDLDVALVAIGGLKPVKNHGLIIRAAAQLNNHAVQTRLTIVGGGVLRRDLAAQARKFNVHLNLPGPQDDVLPWLHDADVFVHAAVSEGCSNAVIEALAAGVPVVVPEIAGMAEAVGEGGVYYSPGDAGALAGAIEMVLENEDLRRKLKVGALAAVERHRESRIVDMYIAVYQNELKCVE